MVSVKANEQKLEVNRSQNVYIGSQITAYAREVMYRHLMEVLKVPNANVYQIECDSLFFSLPQNQMCPLICSPCLGDYKHLYQNISSFYSLGTKQYCVNY